MMWADVIQGIQYVGNQFTLDFARMLFEAVKRLPTSAAILEIGAFHGFTTCALAYGCVDTNRHVFTIDTFNGREANTNITDGPNFYSIFIKNVERCKLLKYVTPLVGQSEDFYKSWYMPVDLLFIDGNHSIMQQDLDAFFPHLRNGGMLFMHDIYESYPLWTDLRRQLVDAKLVEHFASGQKR